MKPFGWEAASGERKTTIVALQWFVAIGTSYLTLGSSSRAVEDPATPILIALLLVSVLVLRRLSDTLFQSKPFTLALAVFDTAVILFGIGLNRNAPWDLFLLFFICVFISAIQDSRFAFRFGNEGNCSSFKTLLTDIHNF